MADAPWNKLKTIVRKWHELALQEIRTKSFEESWFDFVESWKQVRWAADEGPFQDILAKAVATTPPVALKYENPKIRLLISLCCELQKSAGDKPFYLAARKAAEVLGLEHPTQACRLLSGLEADGIIELTLKGSLAKRKASEFRYLPS